MHILFFCQLFYPLLYGGGEVLFRDLTRNLVLRGHEVHVVTQRVAGSPDSEKLWGMRVWRVGMAANYAGALTTGLVESLLYLVGAFVVGIRIALRAHVDLIHSNTYVSSMVAQVCAVILRKKHVMTVHDVYLASLPWFWEKWSRQPNVGFLPRVLGPVLERALLHMPVTMIHTVSETSKRDLLEIGTETRIAVVPNGIMVNENSDDAPMSVDPHRAVFIGRLVFYKNLEVVLRALKRVTRLVPEAKLIIVGDGPMRRTWQDLVDDLDLSDHVRFYGKVPEQEKRHLLSGSAYLILPSLVEGFGLVVLEAFASSKTVLASRIGALAELVSDGVDGYLVHPNSETDWADKMITLFQHPERARDMGLMGLRKATSDFSMDRIAEQMEHAYEQVLKDTRKP